jgi:hypothetical protein
MRRWWSSARASRRSGRAPILDRDDDHSILLLDKHVDDHHPTPRSEHKAEFFPTAAERRSQQRKLLEGLNGTPEPGPCVRRKAVGEDQAFEILDSGCRELDSRHELELVDRDRLSGACLLEPELSALECAGYAVEQLDNVPRVDVGLVDRL